MIIVSVPLPASGFSAVLSLLTLNTASSVGLGLSAGVSTTDTFSLYGTLDSAATDATNAQAIGTFSGTDGTVALPAGIAAIAREWPYLLIQRVSGSGTGTFYAAGDPLVSPAPVSVAAPVAVGAYSAVLNLTSFGASGVRIGGSAAMTAADVFDVFVSEDASIASATGGLRAARITGGGGPNIETSVVVAGYAYAIIQRVSGSTAGSVIAAGVAAVGAVVDAWVQGGNSFGAPGILGTLDAQSMSVIAAGSTFLSDTGGANGTSTIGRGSGTGGTDVRSGSAGMSILSLGSISVTSSLGGAGFVSVRGGGGGVFVTATGAGDVVVTPGSTGSVRLPPRALGAGNTSELRWYDLTNTRYTGFKSPDAMLSDAMYTMPTADAVTPGSCLASDGAGNLSWSTVSTLAWVQGGNSFGAPGVLGTLDAQSMSIRANGSTFLTDTGGAGGSTTLGRTSGASACTMQAGTGGMTLTTVGAANIIIVPGSTGTTWVSQTAIGTTVQTGLGVRNTTSATAIATVQQPGTIRHEGQAWNSGAGGFTATCAIEYRLIPVSNTVATVIQEVRYATPAASGRIAFWANDVTSIGGPGLEMDGTIMLRGSSSGVRGTGTGNPGIAVSGNDIQVKTGAIDGSVDLRSSRTDATAPIRSYAAGETKGAAKPIHEFADDVAGVRTTRAYAMGDGTWNGPVWVVVATQTANYVAAVRQRVPLNPTGGAFDFTLPTAVGFTDYEIQAYMTAASANVVTLKTTGGQTISGSASGALTLGNAVTLETATFVSDGANWWFTRGST